MTGFRGPRVCDIVGITYRQLDYWARTGLVTPSVSKATGSGSARIYSYSDLLTLKVIKGLIDAGMALRTVRGAIGYIRDQLGDDIGSASLVIQGKSSLLVRSGDDLFDVMKNGQGVLNIVPLGNVAEELDAQILEFDTDATEVDRGAGA